MKKGKRKKVELKRGSQQRKRKKSWTEEASRDQRSEEERKRGTSKRKRDKGKKIGKEESKKRARKK
jgi:hypothetical protein